MSPVTISVAKLMNNARKSHEGRTPPRKTRSTATGMNRIVPTINNRWPSDTRRGFVFLLFLFPFLPAGFAPTFTLTLAITKGLTRINYGNLMLLRRPRGLDTAYYEVPRDGSSRRVDYP